MKEHEILYKIGSIADKAEVRVWAVGGFVRDKLLNISGKDIDFVVEGDGPEFARKVAEEMGCSNVVIFEKFHTAMLNVHKFQLEFVGARSESYEKNSRKPHVVSGDLNTDLERRDFTINALAYGLNEDNFGKIVDPFYGKKDLQDKIVRTPLDPEITFKDDPLRILRAIRFATRFEFQIEKRTFNALKKMGHRLEIISQERITTELFHILKADNPSIGFYLMDDADILKYVFPEFLEMKGVEQREGYHHKDAFEHTLKVVDNVASVSDKIELRFAALVHDIAKPKTKEFVPGTGWTFHGHDEIGARMLQHICKRMRIPNAILNYAQKLVRLHLRPIHLSDENVTDSAIRRLLVQAGEDLDDLLILCRADITSGNPDRVRQHLENFDLVTQRLHEVEEKDKMRAFQSPVRGDEIMEVCRIEPGPMVGTLKKMIEEAILDGEIANDHDAALDYLLSIKEDALKNQN
ncbi:HD domain-containing protein [candidate division KSB1 bacterium]|nr:HD domain-containing protein [candidate division KSB1 bacterium]